MLGMRQPTLPPFAPSEAQQTQFLKFHTSKFYGYLSWNSVGSLVTFLSIKKKNRNIKENAY